MTTTIVRHDAEAVLREKQHLAVPHVGAQRTSVREGYDRAFAPVLVIDRRAIFHRDRAHTCLQLPPTNNGLHAAIRKEAAAELRSITKKPVQSLPDRQIDGEDAIGQTSTFVNAGTPITFIQYFVVHDGDAYPVTMTFASDTETTAKGVLADILASWHWES